MTRLRVAVALALLTLAATACGRYGPPERTAPVAPATAPAPPIELPPDPAATEPIDEAVEP
jgi:hypothetical protein